MDELLLDEVLTRLDQAGMDGGTESLVLAACQGSDAVHQAIHGTALERPRTAPAKEPDDIEPPGAYLRSVAVTGFRGIGATSQLDLRPGPGLTLVVGRNGSGKSSFAEGIELALTGRTRRFEDGSKVWKDGWRNLHDAADPNVTVALDAEHLGRVTVEARWQDATKLDSLRTSITRDGEAFSLAELGWDTGLSMYRPFLPYTELGAVITEKPSALHDALQAILGLEDLNNATEHLRQARLEGDRAGRQVKADAKALADELEAIVDERVADAIAALTARGGPDLDALERLLAGEGSPATTNLDRLRAVANLALPDLDDAANLATALREAADGLARIAGTDADRDLATAELLDRAVAFHTDHGDQPCPVCGTGGLDTAWAQQADQRAAELRAAASEAIASRKAATGARDRLERFVGQRPSVLDDADDLGLATAEVRAAHTSLANLLEHVDPRLAAADIEGAAVELHSAVEELRTEAAERVRAAEDAWLPVAPRIGQFVTQARQAQRLANATSGCKAAEDWMKQVADELRAERWAPIGDRAKELWATLRQNSSVELVSVALAGAANQRRVDIDVTIDGKDGAALGVMSQGELHALALSLFLPRATLPASPFRFVVLDDPVQSMDPSKVDGLALVLAEVAADRQVVVFTHDDRLPEAVRRQDIDATIIEVIRGSRSQVSTRVALDPVQRYLDDAHALARSEGVPEIVARQAIGGMLRLAVEAACLDTWRRRRLDRGERHHQIERAFLDNPKLVPRLAMALLDDPGRGSDVYTTLNNRASRQATDAVKEINKGAHEMVTGDLPDLVRRCEEVIVAVARA